VMTLQLARIKIKPNTNTHTPLGQRRAYLCFGDVTDLSAGMPEI